MFWRVFSAEVRPKHALQVKSALGLVCSLEFLLRGADDVRRNLNCLHHCTKIGSSDVHNGQCYICLTTNQLRTWASVAKQKSWGHVGVIADYSGVHR